jgi:hypothetical protein
MRKQAMRKSITLVAAGLMLLGTILTGCGSAEEEDYRITGDSSQATITVPEQPSGDAETPATDTAENGGESVAAGFVFHASTANGECDVYPDQDMAEVLAALGEAGSYYEAASCAFEGLDNMYTYSHFEIDTYPDGEKDRISLIIFWDDLVSTAEGISVGSSFDRLQEVYGSDYTFEEGFYCYQKEGTELRFVVSDDAVSSIQYRSIYAATAGL